MTPEIRKGLVALAALLLMGACASSAAQLRITGMQAGEWLQVHNVQPRLEGTRMLLPLARERTLQIDPWPRQLPATLPPQDVQGQLSMRPAGPTTRLQLTRAGEDQAWLVLALGSRPGAELRDGWRLQVLQVLQEDWWALRGHERVALPLQRAARMEVKGDLWCGLLLQARVPDARTAHLREQEPQADWILARCSDMTGQEP